MAFLADISKNEFSSHLMNGRNRQHEKRQSSPGFSTRLMGDSLECLSELGATSESVCSKADSTGQQLKTPGDCIPPKVTQLETVFLERGLQSPNCQSQVF